MNNAHSILLRITNEKGLLIYVFVLLGNYRQTLLGYSLGESYSTGVSKVDCLVSLVLSVSDKDRLRELDHLNLCINQVRESMEMHIDNVGHRITDKTSDSVFHRITSMVQRGWRGILKVFSSLGNAREGLQQTDTRRSKSPTQKYDFKVISSDGGVVTEKGIKLVFPPGAVVFDVPVSISLEDHSKYYGLVVQNNLQNDVIFGAPVIRLEPDGLLFEKPVTLTVEFEKDNFSCDDIVILHGKEERNRMITWQDITPNSAVKKLKKPNAEVQIELQHFSLVAILLTLVRISRVHLLTRFNLMSFHYTLSVWLKDNCVSPKDDELTLLFVSQDVYHEHFYEQETSAVMELKNKGFRKLHVGPVNEQQESGIYNNESLHISVCLGEDYNLAGKKHEITSDLKVDSYTWWNTGYAVTFPLERSMKDVRIACGTITVQGTFGHISERKFCEVGGLKGNALFLLFYMHLVL